MSEEKKSYGEELDQEFDKALKDLDDTSNAIDEKRKSRIRKDQEAWDAFDSDSVEMSTVRLSDFEEKHEDQSKERPKQTVSSPVKRDHTKKKKKKGKKTGIIIAILVIVILLVGTLFVLHKLNMIGTDGNGFGVSWINDNDIDADDIDSIMDADSLNAWLKAWAENGGDLMKSSHVKNILLIGVDSDSKLSDSMILASINEKTKQITLVSFYRDSYTYINRNGLGGYYGKLNAAYGTGGGKCVVSTIENDYKIDIDNYMLVNYDTFPKIIDSLGGIDVQVTQKEADYLNRTWYKWSRTGKKIQFKSGKMHMDGEHALMFCRIRKLDSDVGRTERQRRVIVAVMNKFQSASLSQLNKTVNVILPNIKTDMKKSEIMKVTSRAVSNGWTKYKVKQMTMPTEDACIEGKAGDQWIWIVDYEVAANHLQKALYQKTNIKLEEGRVSPLSFGKKNANGDANRLPTTQNSDGYYYVYETVPNTEQYPVNSYNYATQSAGGSNSSSSEDVIPAAEPVQSAGSVGGNVLDAWSGN